MQGSETSNHPVTYHIKGVYSEKGIVGFWAGVQATVIRAMFLNGVKLGTYDSIKYAILGSGLLKEGYTV